MGFELFGFSFGKTKKEQQIKDLSVSFAPPDFSDGSLTLSYGGVYGYQLNVDGSTFQNETEQIRKYREIACNAEIEQALDDIINEAIVNDLERSPVTIKTDSLNLKEETKVKIKKEFENILKLLKFNQRCFEIFRRWYIDGRLYYHIIVDESKPESGIIELRQIDPIKIRKIQEIEKQLDSESKVEVIKDIKEYFIYSDTILVPNQNDTNVSGLKISPECICYITSGLFDYNSKRVLSYLHKAIKPLNQLKMIEDAVLIYRLSRAPERRIFYIDVGNLPKNKAEEYIKSLMSKYRNKLVYDSSTGQVVDEKNHMSMLEDFWLPRREGGRGTEISTLPGGQNLGELEDVKYFKKKLFQSLNVPISRMDPEQRTVSLGRVNEITRDELKFSKFIIRIRSKFSELFLELLKTQLKLKNIATEEDWNLEIQPNIFIDYLEDSYFSESKTLEMLSQRVNLLNTVNPYVIEGYFSKNWIKKNILRFTDDEITDISSEMLTDIENKIKIDAFAAKYALEINNKINQESVPMPGSASEPPSPQASPLQTNMGPVGQAPPIQPLPQSEPKNLGAIDFNQTNDEE